jgi:quinol-cytochrome oxidoreductase complex cytochrome b subunit
MSGKFKNWLMERLPFDQEKTSQIMEKIFLKEPIPKHMKNWYYALGAAPLILFFFMVFTGILLTFYYIPSPDKAYESIRFITEEVSMGFWIRGIHRWASNLMVIALMLHMIRVFFTRGYRKPREFNWIIGILMLGVTLTLCFTGYSMVYNQLSYWAATVGTNMIKEIPLIGPSVLGFLRGGEEVTSNTLTRFFNLHIGFLPTILFLLIVVHIVLIRMHGVAKLENKEDEETYSFYPDHFYHTIIIALFLLTFISALTVILPPGLGEQADPLNTPQHIKPEWYFFAVYSVLKFIPLKIGIYLFTALAMVATFWPFIDDIFLKKWPKVKVHYWVGSFTIVLFLFFTVYEILVY